MKVSLLFFFFLIHFICLSQNEWKLVKDKDSIKIYTKESENLPFVMLKVNASFNTSLGKMVSLLQDISSQPDYIEGCLSAVVVGYDKDSSQIYYQKSHMPWPFKNRDGVYSQKLLVTGDTSKVIMVIELVDDYLPISEKYVRMQAVNASWEFNELSESFILGEYKIKFDPAGSIPAWVVNAFVDIAPYESIIKMKKILSEND